MLKILHIISGLKNGGAENTLYKICKYDLANKHTIISLGGIQDKYFKILKDLNIELYTIKLKFFSFLFDFFLIINLIKKKILTSYKHGCHMQIYLEVLRPDLLVIRILFGILDIQK